MPRSARRVVRLLLTSLVALFWPSPGVPQVPPVPTPPLKAHVTDLAGTFTPEQAASLDTKLRNFEKTKGSQVAVLLLPTTGPESIETFSLRVANEWGLGRKGIDDGVLVVVALKDRRLRIEVGRGLTAALPDATAAQIIQQFMIPKFRGGDYFGGVDAGVDCILGAIRQSSVPPTSPKAPGPH